MQRIGRYIFPLFACGIKIDLANVMNVQNQDHYAVLGLSKYRWRATDEQIKKAHRKKVLKHHPDKKASAGQSDDDSFFKCIQKGMFPLPAMFI